LIENEIKGGTKMEFEGYKALMQAHFKKMCEGRLFEVDVDKDELWNLYLDSFPPGTNEIYRKRREFDCSCCRHFIKQCGNIVAIDKNYNIVTLWDFKVDDIYQPVNDALAAYIKARPISNVFFAKENKVGVDRNHELDVDKVKEWHHFYLELPSNCVVKRDLNEKKGDCHASKDVFKRSLDDISEDSITTVLEIISSGSLYRGEEWKGALESLLSIKRAYDALKEKEKDNFVWVKSQEVGGAVSRIRNHSMGTLLLDITNNADLDEAVRKYEKIVAPTNYKRPKEIYTKKMLSELRRNIEEAGYMSSLRRRHATLDDINVNNILFSNRDSARRISRDDIFGQMEEEVAITPRSFSRVEEITVEDFVRNVLPLTRELYVLFESRHTKNAVSLIAPQDRSAPTMFKWGNPFSWAYAGNIADSDIRENVKAAGGRVDGVLRFSIQWNDGSEHNANDFDAHCVEPDGTRIFFNHKRSLRTCGNLDVDIIRPTRNQIAVENITYPSKSLMIPGLYKFSVHLFNDRGGRGGFKAELEASGQVYNFEHSRKMVHKETVEVVDVRFDGMNFIVAEKLPSSVSSREFWNLSTNQFIPVSVVMYSPNYWDEQRGIGNKHYFFMLRGMINPEQPNGFYNEFLKEELLKYKHAIAALGSKVAVVSSDDQLSGIGFSSTRKDELIVKVIGQTERIMKVKF
jgi:hypothetical protein